MNIQIHKNIINNEEINSVNARDLHNFLEVKTKFTDWIKRAIYKYDFEDNIDFSKLSNANPGGGIARVDYIVTLGMAKELSMLENNKKGKQARKYFIECEKKSRESYPQIPQSYPQALKLAYEQALVIEKQNIQIEDQKPKVETFNKFISVDTVFSMNDTAKLIGIGRNKLFTMMRDDCILMSNNIPYQYAMDAGYFIVKEKIINVGNNSKVVSTTYVTTKGQVFLNKKYGDMIKQNDKR